MIKIKQQEVELLLKEIAEQTADSIIKAGIPVIVTYHTYVSHNWLRTSRISIIRTDIPNHTPIEFYNKNEIISIIRGRSTTNEVSSEHVFNYLLWHTDIGILKSFITYSTLR